MAVIINHARRPKPRPRPTVITGTVGLCLFIAMLDSGLFLASPNRTNTPQHTTIPLVADASDWL